jgi:DNA-binding PadR family transcriptional regulator
MAMRSPVNWALLGLVIQRASYGYELVQRFERTYGDAIELSSRSHIYGALDSLTARGLIERAPAETVGDEEARQPKPHYRATEAGICSYEHWLISYMEEDRRRARIFARQVGALRPEHALRVLSRLSESSLRDIGRPPAKDGGDREHDPPEASGERLVDEQERLRAGAMLTWIQFAKREIRDACRQRS